MDKTLTYQVEVVGRVCILNEIETYSDGRPVTDGANKRLAAGTPKMIGDAIRIALTNAIAGATEPTRSGGGL